MPPQPVIDRWIRVVVRLVHEGSTILMPMNLRGLVPGPYSSSNLQALAQNYWTTLSNTLLATLPATYQVLDVTATDRSIVNGATGSYTISTGGQGTRTGDAFPANVSDCISWRTGLTGRANRGRSYLPGPTDVDALGSTFTSPYTITVSNFITALLLYAGTGTIPSSIAVASLSRLVMVPIITGIVDYIVDSQRRRLPGRGF